MLDADVGILSSVHDQGGSLDGAQDIEHIRVHDGIEEETGAGPARAQALRAKKPSTPALVALHARGEDVQGGRSSPLHTHQVDIAIPHFGRQTTGIATSPHESGVGVEQNQRRDALGERRSKEHRGTASCTKAGKRNSRRSHVSHDRAEVVVPRVEVWQGLQRQRVGASGSSRVHPNVPGEPAEAPENRDDARLFPDQIHRK